jgi:SRSO17 transposase
VAVYLTYATPRGHALIDRALYLPRSWTDDQQRCEDAGIPTGKRGFVTKPTLAKTLIDRAVTAKVPAAWVAGDEATVRTRNCAPRSVSGSHYSHPPQSNHRAA